MPGNIERTESIFLVCFCQIHFMHISNVTLPCTQHVPRKIKEHAENIHPIGNVLAMYPLCRMLGTC